MSEQQWLEAPALRQLVEELVDKTVAQYRLDRAAAESLVHQVLSRDARLSEATARETSPDKLKRTRAFQQAAAAAKRRVYYELRRYHAPDAVLQDMIDELRRMDAARPVAERRQLLDDLAQQHASTRERAPSLAEFHRQLFAAIGEPRSVLDLGCGLHPLTFPFDGAGKTVEKYVALDSSELAVSAVNAYAQARNDRRLQAVEYDLAGGWQPLRQQFGSEEFDVALLLKLVPVVQRQARHVLPILTRTPARTWVLSGSTTSLTRRRSIERRERSVLQRFLESSKSRIVAEYTLDQEFVVIVQ